MSRRTLLQRSAEEGEIINNVPEDLQTFASGGILQANNELLGTTIKDIFNIHRRKPAAIFSVQILASCHGVPLQAAITGSAEASAEARDAIKDTFHVYIPHTRSFNEFSSKLEPSVLGTNFYRKTDWTTCLLVSLYRDLSQSPDILYCFSSALAMHCEMISPARRLE